jgi:hypothetical protein
MTPARGLWGDDHRRGQRRMPQFNELIPTFEILQSMSVEDVGHALLKVAKSQVQNGTFWPDGLIQVSSRIGYREIVFPEHKREVEQICGEALNWLSVNSLIMPAPGLNGSNGYKMLSTKGEALADQTNLDSFRHAASFSKALLHPSIADRAWSMLNRGDYEAAELEAFRAVEEAVREVGKFKPTDIGVPMMRRAFDKDNHSRITASQNRNVKHWLISLPEQSAGTRIDTRIAPKRSKLNEPEKRACSPRTFCTSSTLDDDPQKPDRPADDARNMRWQGVQHLIGCCRDGVGARFRERPC